jgi:hypothetical protein
MAGAAGGSTAQTQLPNPTTMPISTQGPSSIPGAQNQAQFGMVNGQVKPGYRGPSVDSGQMMGVNLNPSNVGPNGVSSGDVQMGIPKTAMTAGGGIASGVPASTAQPSSGFNVNTAAAEGLQKGMQGIQAGMAGTAQGMNYYSPMYAGAYMNPYEKSVIGGLQQDARTNYEMGANRIGQEATAAGAFGGSRHGVAQGTMAADVQNQLNRQIGDLRYQGYNQAQSQALADQQMRLGASNQMGSLGTALGGMGQQAFNMGQQATANLQNVGLQQQAIQQALIDAAKGQYSGYTGASGNSLAMLAQALGASPTPQTTTNTKQPGLFDYLTMAATAYGSK